MSDRHLSTQFDAELSGISTRVLEMGGMVESQVARAVHALVTFNGELASEVLATEERVNQTEVEIDLDLSTIIASRPKWTTTTAARRRRLSSPPYRAIH